MTLLTFFPYRAIAQRRQYRGECFIVTAWYLRPDPHLGFERKWIATLTPYYRGHNPSDRESSGTANRSWPAAASADSPIGIRP